ncbi:class I SAM-dependent methyltransferase [Olsenella profusa]|uniref:Class I SAM-dependent methyltransferase n=1 Tax=Olsenella profusa TaxID=138595 RepID=A0ABS2F0T4_9ACTN|nr:class I SAM-dependent methyltransferase [Olsenella profusa]MBM6774575.1 class I SAM-dependent methyltransferase [Olsenella profusa]
MDEKNAELLKARSRAAFDAQAATYDEGREGARTRLLYPYVVREVARAVAGRDAPRLLDLGCGTGALAERVFAEVPGARVTGIDLAPGMVGAARSRLGDRAEIRLGDAERLPFHEASFDAVWCNDSFHHYPDPDRAAFQAWRVLAPGGVLVIGDTWQPAPARAVMNAWMARSREGDVHMYSESELRGILGAWFDEVSWRRVGTTACVAVARKGR